MKRAQKHKSTTEQEGEWVKTVRIVRKKRRAGESRDRREGYEIELDDLFMGEERERERRRENIIK